MIISRTPYRISFFGGGTDYPVWYENNGGEVLASTINHYCYLTCRFLPPFYEHKYRIVYSKTETCASAEKIKHPVVREVLRAFQFEEGIEIHHDGDLPARSGIGSSSSFTVSLLHALHVLRGKNPSKEELAKEAILIEQKILKETVGSQDQFQAAFGGLNHIIFSRDKTVDVNPLALSEARKEELEDHLMLFFTGVRPPSSEIAASYAGSFGKIEKGLGRLKALVPEAISVLSGTEEICRFGKLLDESWKIKSKWSDKVAPKRILEIYQAAREAGALGGKLTGAGGGGFLLLFVPPEKKNAVRERLNKLVEILFKLESTGSRIVFNDEERHGFDEAKWLDLRKEMQTAVRIDE